MALTKAAKPGFSCLLLLLFLMMLAASADASKPSFSSKAAKAIYERAYRLQDEKCRSTCSYSPELDASEESINCWKRCISPVCYQTYYGDDPCEEGEVDVRQNDFRKCFYMEEYNDRMGDGKS